MKRKCFIALCLLFCCNLCVQSQNREYFSKKQIISEFNEKVKYSLTKPYESSDLYFSDDKIGVDFFPIKDYDGIYFIGITVKNNTANRIYIEWENARINGSKVVFSDDSRLLMSNVKSDEVVVSGEKSETKKIMPKDNVHDNHLLALFRYNNDRSIDIPIILPIRYDNNIVDYKFSINLSKYSEAEIDSMYNKRLKYHKLSKTIKKGMTIDQVVSIMGSEEKELEITDIDQVLIYPFVYVNLDEKMKVKSVNRE